MSKTREIIVEVKKSKSFQTFTCSEILTIEENDDLQFVKREAFARCRKDVLEQIEIDQQPPKPTEVQRKIIKG